MFVVAALFTTLRSVFYPFFGAAYYSEIITVESFIPTYS
jgi:hypothetical protein